MVLLFRIYDWVIIAKIRTRILISFNYICSQLFLKLQSFISHFGVKVQNRNNKWTQKFLNIQYPVVGLNLILNDHLEYHLTSYSGRISSRCHLCTIWQHGLSTKDCHTIRHQLCINCYIVLNHSLWQTLNATVRKMM